MPRKKAVHETIRSLAHSYFDVCKLMEQMNKYFAIRTVIILVTTVSNFIVTFYNILMPLVIKADVNRTDLLHFLWSAKHIMSMILLVEPCHWTYQESIRTRQLIAQLTCRTVTAIGPLAVEMKRFFWSVRLNKMLYSPLGTCTIKRPMYVSILGASTTYFVMVMQFDIENNA